MQRSRHLRCHPGRTQGPRSWMLTSLCAVVASFFAPTFISAWCASLQFGVKMSNSRVNYVGRHPQTANYHNRRGLISIEAMDRNSLLVLKNDFGLAKVANSTVAVQLLVSALEEQAKRDQEMPQQLKQDIGYIGVKFKSLRDSSRVLLHDIKDTALYFIKWLKRIRDDARSQESRPEKERSRRIGVSLQKLAGKLDPLLSELEACGQAYSSVYNQIDQIKTRAEDLREQSEFKEQILLGASVLGAVLGAAGALSRNPILAAVGGTSAASGLVLQQQYMDLSRFYDGFIDAVRSVSVVVQQEQDKLRQVQSTLEGAADDVTNVNSDYTQQDFDFLADSAEDGIENFKKLVERCDGSINRMNNPWEKTFDELRSASVVDV